MRSDRFSRSEPQVSSCIGTFNSRYSITFFYCHFNQSSVFYSVECFGLIQLCKTKNKGRPFYSYCSYVKGSALAVVISIHSWQINSCDQAIYHTTSWHRQRCSKISRSWITPSELDKMWTVRIADRRSNHTSLIFTTSFCGKFSFSRGELRNVVSLNPYGQRTK